MEGDDHGVDALSRYHARMRNRYRIPDDNIDPKRYPLFYARELLTAK